MSTMQELDGLLSTLNTAVEEALAYFEGPGATSTARVGDWGPREVLCHFLFWHEATAEGMESASGGGGPRIMAAAVDDLNAQAVAQHAEQGIPQLTAHARILQERVAQAARQLPNLDVVVMQRADGSSQTARDRLDRIPRHWQAHIAELQA